ncbi:MAG: AEC family transporter [Butyricicoccus sp.]|nr:AEC family transporter [Butyricicoccus sp.]
MLSILLAKKIASLFLIILTGALLIRTKICRPEDSKVLSMFSVYLIMPCNILAAFQVEGKDRVREGLLLAFAAAILVHIVLLLLGVLMRRTLRLDPVEQVSIIYPNAGNLIVPLVTALLGADWVIYTSAYISVQTALLWSHCKSTLCGERGIDLKKIFSNINMIAVLIGIVLFVFDLRFPAIVQDAVSSVAGMVGPSAMLVTGMLIGSMDLRAIFRFKRLGLIVALRLLIVPVLIVLLLRFSGIASFVENGEMILLITLLASISPSASTVTQMAQIYGRNAPYASAINVATTLGCIVTMPLMVGLYQIL